MEVVKPSLVPVVVGCLLVVIVVVTRHLSGLVVIIDNGATATGRCWRRVSCCRHFKQQRDGNIVCIDSKAARAVNSHTLVSLAGGIVSVDTPRDTGGISVGASAFLLRNTSPCDYIVNEKTGWHTIW